MKMKINDPKLALRMKILADICGNSNKLAIASGLKLPTIKKYMAGTSDPSRLSLIALSKATGCRIEWISTGDGPMKICEEIDQSCEAREAEKDYEFPANNKEFIPYPSEFKPTLDAVVEVISSHDEIMKTALIQNAFAFQKAVQNGAKIDRLEQDMEAIKRRLLSGPVEEPREDDFKIQGTKRAGEHRGKKHHASGG
jgi:hypothetical protein